MSILNDEKTKNLHVQHVAVPLCPYYGQCGGCSAQHIAYATQLENKKKYIATAAGVLVESVAVFSGEAYHYRNRMDFIFHEKGIGLRRRDRWQDVIDIESCAISDSRLNVLIKEIRAHFWPDANTTVDAFDQKKLSGTYKYVVVRTPKFSKASSSISFVLNTNSTKIDEATQKIEAFAKKTSAHSVIIAYVPKDREAALSDDCVTIKGSDMISEIFLEKELTYSTQAFFQNNSAMAQEMIRYVRDCIGVIVNHSQYHLLDLYGGVGTFGICCADLVKSTLIIESVSQAIDAAKINIERNTVQNVVAKVMDAGQLKKLTLPAPLIIITDPPRSGMDQKTIEQINKLAPDVLIYISCNPSQMEKELPRIVGHTVERVAMFDLFPQTNHAEAVVILKKKL